MQKFFLILVLLNLAFTPTLSLAKEPPNLDLCKKRLQIYHDSGQYEKDFNKVILNAFRYLKMHLANQTQQDNKKPAIILDIDETSLSNYSELLKLDFGSSPKEFNNVVALSNAPAFKPTLRLYQFAKKNNVAVFFVSGRDEKKREATIRNLIRAGYNNWDGLILRSKNDVKKLASEFKVAIRKQLIQQGYEIILNIGDQKSDLIGGYANKSFKLPDPYYLIN